MDEIENPIKVILLGESGVGKSSLIDRYCNNKFNENISQTFSASFCLKPMNYNNKKYNFCLWDTCGKEAFRSLTKIFLTDAKIIILVYDITNKESFLELQFWLDHILDRFGGNNNLILVGNKNDLRDKRQIKESDAKKFADTIHAQFAEVNAKEYGGLNEFLDNVLNIYLKNTYPVNTNVNHIEFIDYDDDLLLD